MKLPKWLESVEWFVDRSVPFLLVILTFLIIFGFTEYADKYHDQIIILDNIIIAFFVVDLLFKYNHSKSLVRFFKVYWIDIIAVFPFYLIFRLYFVVKEAAFATEQAQKVLHEAALVRETRLIKESRLVAELSKEGKLARAFLRGLRLLRMRWYVLHGHLQALSAQYRKAHRAH
ncbi:hypothetical protein D6825_03950 [Candidatus Woesearchaeota archaeon]|nr:MAG: hypothetical protein D6825_03950 [Candidatus Woesearchaeota archaeon]